MIPQVYKISNNLRCSWSDAVSGCAAINIIVILSYTQKMIAFTNDEISFEVDYTISD